MNDLVNGVPQEAGMICLTPGFQVCMRLDKETIGLEEMDQRIYCNIEKVNITGPGCRLGCLCYGEGKKR